MADLPNVNIEQIEEFKRLANTDGDTSILMLNLNRYRPEAGYPNGELYKEYIAVLDQLLSEVGGKILWRTHLHGVVVGEQKIYEALGIWYPSHAAFFKSHDSSFFVRKYEASRRDGRACRSASL